MVYPNLVLVASTFYVGIIVRRNIGQMAYRVELEYRLFLSIDSSLYIGLRQYFSEGVQNFVHWHFLKSNMAAVTPKYH